MSKENCAYYDDGIPGYCSPGVRPKCCGETCQNYAVNSIDTLQQLGAEINEADIASFRAKVKAAAIAVARGPGAVATLSEHLVGRYKPTTLKRLALLEPLLEHRPELVTPDTNLGIVWQAFKLCSDDDGYVDLRRFEQLLDEALDNEYSLADAKAAWGVEQSEKPGSLDLGTGRRIVISSDEGTNNYAIITDGVPPENLARVKVWI